MKIAVGNDHRGVTVKQRLVGLLKELGHEVDDLGRERRRERRLPRLRHSRSPNRFTRGASIAAS